MNDSNLHDEDSAVSSGSLRAGHFVAIVLVAAAIVVAVYLWQFRDRGGATGVPGSGNVTVVPEGSRTVTLYFGDSERTTLVGETRQVAIGRDFIEQVSQVMRALLVGPEHDAVTTIPEGTKLLGVFYDTETTILFLDLSSEFIAGHSGGSAAEYHTVSAIMKTISENFPEVQAVHVLIEGSQIGTIAGHIDAQRPFVVRNWR